MAEQLSFGCRAERILKQGERIPGLAAREEELAKLMVYMDCPCLEGKKVRLSPFNYKAWLQPCLLQTDFK